MAQSIPSACPPTHAPVHDLESFFYVLLSISVQFDGLSSSFAELDTEQLPPAMQAPLQTTTMASLATSESEPEFAELEDPAATALALRREYDELLPASRQEEEASEDTEEASSSPLQALGFDLFPSPFATSERWAPAERARDSAFHEAIAEAVAEAVAKEEAAVEWSVSQSEASHGEAFAVTIAGEEAVADRLEEQGVIARAESLRTARKGKSKAIEVPARNVRTAKR